MLTKIFAYYQESLAYVGVTVTLHLATIYSYNIYSNSELVINRLCNLIAETRIVIVTRKHSWCKGKRATAVRV